MKPNIPVQVGDCVVACDLEYAGSLNSYRIDIDFPTNRLFVDVASGPVFLSDDSDQALEIKSIAPREEGLYWIKLRDQTWEPALWDCCNFKTLADLTLSLHEIELGDKYSDC